MAQQMINVVYIPVVRQSAYDAVLSTTKDQLVEPYNYYTLVDQAKTALESKTVQEQAYGPLYYELRDKVK